MTVYSAVGQTLSGVYGLLLRTILCDVIVYSYCTCTCLSSAVYCMYICSAYLANEGAHNAEHRHN